MLLARLAALAALTLAGCVEGDITACVARCQAFTAEPTVCETLCTRSCPELQRSFGITEQACNRLQHGDGPPPATATPSETPATPTTPRPALTPKCNDFVAFAYSCGIGRPAPDPTLDITTQQNNEMVIRQTVVAACERKDPPYDEALIGCYQTAAGDCEDYKRCADAAVAARPAGL